MTSFISLSGLIGNVIVISKFSAQRHLSEKRNLSASYPNTGVHKLIDKSHRWRKTAIAAATAAIFGLLGSNAAALSLGRITVQSALGEPLRAEIDIPSINAEEAASLQTVIASPEAFRAAGLEPNKQRRLGYPVRNLSPWPLTTKNSLSIMLIGHLPFKSLTQQFSAFNG